MRYVILLFLVVVFLSVSVYSAEKQAPDLQYKKEVEYLERMSHSIALQKGKAKIIGMHRDLIDAHPGYEDNLYLETRIAKIQGWNLYEKGEPTDAAGAFETLTTAIEKYDKSNPHMKHAMTKAAERSADLYPEKSIELYKQIIKQYPDDDPLRLECYWALGLAASKQDKKELAEEYYSIVLKYEPTSLRMSRELDRIQTAKMNSANGLFWVAYDPRDPPVARLAKVEAMLKKYPVIELWRAEIVHPRLERLREQVRHLEDGFLEEAAGPHVTNQDSIDETSEELRPKSAIDANTVLKQKNIESRENHLLAQDTVSTGRIWPLGLFLGCAGILLVSAFFVVQHGKKH